MFSLANLLLGPPPKYIDVPLHQEDVDDLIRELSKVMVAHGFEDFKYNEPKNALRSSVCRCLKHDCGYQVDNRITEHYTKWIE